MVAIREHQDNHTSPKVVQYDHDDFSLLKEKISNPNKTQAQNKVAGGGGESAINLIKEC